MVHFPDRPLERGCEALELREPAVRRCLRRRRAASACQLGERGRRMASAQVADLPKLPWKIREETLRLELAERAELQVCSPARAAEVRVVGVGEPVRVAAGRPDDGGLLER